MFIFLTNALTLLLASWLTTNLFGLGLVIDGFRSALVGALLISPLRRRRQAGKANASHSPREATRKRHAATT